MADELILGNVIQRFLTVYFDFDEYVNHDLQVRWAKVTGSSVVMSNSIATSITADRTGNVFVTGYMQTPKNPET